MAFLQDPGAQQVPDRRPSPGLSLNLSSNNPFRNPRNGSPGGLSPAILSPNSQQRLSPRLSPSNPFLAAHEQVGGQQTDFNPSPIMTETRDSVQSQQRLPTDNEASQLFHRLTLNDSQATNGASLTNGLTQARSNGVNQTTSSNHKPSRSDEAERRRDPRMRPRPRAPPGELDIFASPEKRDSRRPRRNSDSSVASKSSLNDEERRRRRRREQEGRSGSSKPRDSSSSKHRDSSKIDKDRDSSKPRAPRRKARGMDLIDQLDQTGIYGAGFIHHDGPFDAVNPHRNRRKDERAPMLAFPTGSKNMMLGGSGPLNKGIDLERFHGVGAEGFSDFSSAADLPKPTKLVQTFDSVTKVDPVHGEETFGLGTSTFLEGAPASRKAIQRRESETMGSGVEGGLQRKKSLAQRIRGISRNDRPGYQGRVMGDGATSPPTPQLPARMIQSAGGPSRAVQGESNPFDNMYDDAFDKKGAAIKVAEKERGVDADAEYVGRARAPSSPRRNMLERRATADSAGDDGGESKPSGFLNRVKSLKGGKRRGGP